MRQIYLLRRVLILGAGLFLLVVGARHAVDAVPLSRRLGVRVHIDKTRGEDTSGCVDCLTGIDGEIASERDNAAIVDSDIAMEPGTAGPVDDSRLPDHQIDNLRADLRNAGSEQRQEAGRAEACP